MREYYSPIVLREERLQKFYYRRGFIHGWILAMFTAAAIVVAMFWISSAYGATNHPELSARLPVPMTVICADNPDDWAAMTGHYSLPSSAIGFTDYASWTIHLSPYVCVTLRNGLSDPDWPIAALTLYHEFIHAREHTTVEHNAECGALYFYRYWLRKYWHLTAARAQAAYNTAWVAHTDKPLAYQGCINYKTDPVSPYNGFK